MRMIVIIRMRGGREREIAGIWPTDWDAICSGIDAAGEPGCRISVRRLA